MGIAVAHTFLTASRSTVFLDVILLLFNTSNTYPISLYSAPTNSISGGGGGGVQLYSDTGFCQIPLHMCASLTSDLLSSPVGRVVVYVCSSNW